MKPSRSWKTEIAAGFLIAVACLTLSGGFRGAACAQQVPPGVGRLYVFREVRSFGGHIDDYITINGVRVHRVTPGTGFYCDLKPGIYAIGVLQHKTNPMQVSVAIGQSQYVSVMLHKLGGVSQRGGGITPDQSFVVRLLEPDYGAQRMREYHMVSATCQ